MQEMVDGTSDVEVKIWKNAMDSELDSESDTEDDFGQQWAIRECMCAAMMLDDSPIPEQGIDRKCATGIQRAVINFWTQMDKAYQATKNKKVKIPNRCWKKLEAVRRKSYKPIVLEEIQVTTGK